MYIASSSGRKTKVPELIWVNSGVLTPGVLNEGS